MMLADSISKRMCLLVLCTVGTVGSRRGKALCSEHKHHIPWVFPGKCVFYVEINLEAVKGSREVDGVMFSVKLRYVCTSH